MTESGGKIMDQWKRSTLAANIQRSATTGGARFARMRDSLLGRSSSPGPSSTASNLRAEAESPIPSPAEVQHSSRPLSMASETPRRKPSESLENIRASIFGSKSKRSSFAGLPSRKARPVSTSSSFFSGEPEPRFSRDFYVSDEAYYQALRDRAISEPFNFQHVTHTSRDNLPSLDKVDQSNLKAEFWSASGYRARLSGVRYEDLPSSQPSPTPSRASLAPSSREMSPARSRVVTPIGIPTSIDQTMYDDRSETRSNPDEVLLPTAANTPQFPSRRIALGPRLYEQRPWSPQRSLLSQESLVSINSDDTPDQPFQTPPEVMEGSSYLDTVPEEHESRKSLDPSALVFPVAPQEPQVLPEQQAPEEQPPLQQQHPTTDEIEESQGIEETDFAEATRSPHSGTPLDSVPEEKEDRSIAGGSVKHPTERDSALSAATMNTDEVLPEQESVTSEEPADVANKDLPADPVSERSSDVPSETHTAPTEPPTSPLPALPTQKAIDESAAKTAEEPAEEFSEPTAGQNSENEANSELPSQEEPEVISPENIEEAPKAIVEEPSEATAEPTHETVFEPSKEIVGEPSEDITEEPSQRIRETQVTVPEEPSKYGQPVTPPNASVASLVSFWANQNTKPGPSVKQSPVSQNSTSTPRSTGAVSSIVEDSIAEDTRTVSTSSTPISPITDDGAWEDDVDFAYEQDAEASCHFDWQNLSPTIDAKSLDGGALPTIQSPTSNPIDLRRAAHTNSISNRASLEKGHSRVPSIGHKGFVAARGSATAPTSPENSVEKPVLRNSGPAGDLRQGFMEDSADRHDLYHNFIKTGAKEDSHRVASPRNSMMVNNGSIRSGITSAGDLMSDTDSNRLSLSEITNSDKLDWNDKLRFRSLFNRSMKRSSGSSTGSGSMPDMFLSSRKAKAKGMIISSPVPLGPQTPPKELNQYEMAGLMAPPPPPKDYVQRHSGSFRPQQGEAPGERAAPQYDGPKAQRRPVTPKRFSRLIQTDSGEPGWI